MNDNKNICPCCGKGCDLSAPRCPRGEEYARTGVISPRSEGHCKHGHGNHENRKDCHGDHEHRHEHHRKECGCHEHKHHEHGSEDCKDGHKGNRFSHYSEMDTNDKILAQMSKLTHQSHHIFGGRGGQKRILHIIGKEGSMTQRELTERLDIQPGSASEIIKKLETAGYILRTANEADRRTSDISLTDSGIAQLQELDAERKNRRNELFSSLSPEEAEQLLTLLEKLSTEWDSHLKAHNHPRHKEG